MANWLSLISTTFIISSTISNFSIETHCSSLGPQLKSLANNLAPFNFDIKKALQYKNKDLGAGAFGSVVQLTTDGTNSWPAFLGSKAALKRVSVSKKDVAASYLLELLRNELKAMSLFNGRRWAPYFYACVNNNPEFFIAQEILYLPLDNPTVVAEFQKKYFWDILSAFLPLFRGIKEMSELNFVHNDIKPANIMAKDESLSELKFIDFGFADKIVKQPFQIAVKNGTPHYLSPNRRNGNQHFPLDDLYALVLSIAALFDVRDELFKMTVFNKAKQRNELVNIPDDCFTKSFLQICVDALTANVAKIFTEKGFGNYDPKTTQVENMNGTTLFAHVIRFTMELQKAGIDPILKRLEELNEEYQKIKASFEEKVKKEEEEKKKKLEEEAQEKLRLQKLEDERRQNELKQKLENERIQKELQRKLEDERKQKLENEKIQRELQKKLEEERKRKELFEKQELEKIRKEKERLKEEEEEKWRKEQALRIKPDLFRQENPKEFKRIVPHAKNLNNYQEQPTIFPTEYIAGQKNIAHQEKINLPNQINSDSHNHNTMDSKNQLLLDRLFDGQNKKIENAANPKEQNPNKDYPLHNDVYLGNIRQQKYYNPQKSVPNKDKAHLLPKIENLNLQQPKEQVKTNMNIATAEERIKIPQLRTNEIKPMHLEVKENPKVRQIWSDLNENKTDQPARENGNKKNFAHNANQQETHDHKRLGIFDPQKNYNIQKVFNEIGDFSDGIKKI